MHTIFVITVCRNAESLIEDTIKSVLSQTYQNVKYIIIDGASTDGTVDIIKKYQDKLTYWVSEPDKGIYDAMNKGLAKAREFGDGWVNFMNAGDTFTDSNTIGKVFIREDLDYDNLKMIGGATWNVYKDASKTFLDPAKHPSVIPTKIPFSHQACFTKLDVCNFDTSYKIAADYALMYSVYFEYGPDSIVSLDNQIANYERDDSFSTLNPKKAKGEYLKIQAKHKSFHWWKEYIKWRFYSREFKQ